MTTAIQQYLPENLWSLAEWFDIPESFLENNASLIQLILESKSLAEHTEKQNWFNLLPIMSQEQIDKLNDIYKQNTSYEIMSCSNDNIRSQVCLKKFYYRNGRNSWL